MQQTYYLIRFKHFRLFHIKMLFVTILAIICCVDVKLVQIAAMKVEALDSTSIGKFRKLSEELLSENGPERNAVSQHLCRLRTVNIQLN